MVVPVNTYFLVSLNFMNYRTLYFLDRNVVSEIKSFNKTKQKNPKTIKIQSIDKRYFIVTPICSILEGNNASPQDDNQKISTIKDEVSEVERFFKKARTDAKILLEYENISSILANHIDKKYEIWRELLDFLNKKIHQKVKESDRKEIFMYIVDYCKNKQVSYAHLVPALCISILYENKENPSEARKIIKFGKKFNSYNAFSDINFIMCFYYLKQKIGMVNNNTICKIFTFDKGLQSLYENIVVDKMSISSDVFFETHSISYDYDKSIFGDMPSDLYNDYIDNKF